MGNKKNEKKNGIMEVVFIRRGQKTYQLRRDVIYDNLDELMMSPVFVQKGWLKDSDPFIFNPEQLIIPVLRVCTLAILPAIRSAVI